LLNSTQYAGEEVTIGIDAVNYPVTIITNGIHSKAQIQLTGQTLGDHTISLVDPPGCFDPLLIACSRSVSKAGEDWFWDEAGTASVQTVVPVKTALLGNYPNPFNPTTVIKYELSSNVNVNLKLYDLLGREVMTLVDKPQTRGYYHVTLDASRLGNGVYFYRMIAGSFVETRKILLVK
jgi:hypothetical protein